MLFDLHRDEMFPNSDGSVPDKRLESMNRARNEGNSPNSDGRDPVKKLFET